MNNFVVAGLVLLLASPTAMPVVQQAKIVAHRGAPFDAPENTVASAKIAWAQNADAVEADIHLTKDGEIIVAHDPTTKGIGGRDIRLADLTLAELRSIDVGSRRGRQFAGEKMPTLDELIATVPTGKKLFVEIKTGPEILPSLGESLARSRATEDSVVLISFNFEALRQAHERWPQYKTLWLVGYGGESPPIEKIIEQARAADFDGLDLNANWPLDASDVQQIKTAGLQLHVWTVDSSVLASHWIGMGADSITTNIPGLLKELLAS